MNKVFSFIISYVIFVEYIYLLSSVSIQNLKTEALLDFEDATYRLAARLVKCKITQDFFCCC